MKLWYLEYEVLCPSEQLLFRELKESRLNVRGLVRCGGKLRLSVPFFRSKTAERIFTDLHAEFTICGRGRGARAVSSIKKRGGLAVGAALCTGVLLFSQSRVVSVEVLTEDEDIRRRVTEVLEECGVKAGAYIPGIERVKVERQLRQSVEDISWAGITLTDCSVIVDVLEDIPQPQRADDRCPTDLVAAHDAVIDKLELYSGTAVKTVGSGVVEGEVLVSGLVPVEHTSVDKEGKPVTERTEKLVRSIGKVYGSFTVTESFTQPLSETQLVYTSGSEKRRMLRFFSADIPLYFSEPKGMVSESEKYSPLKIFGEELPVGVTTKTMSPYSFRTVKYTQEQAERQVKLAEKRYMRNFLDSYEIKGRSEKLETAEESVTLTVTYELYGVISEERAFYSPDLKVIPDVSEKQAEEEAPEDESSSETE